MDYEAKIADIKGAILIKVDNRQSTAILVNKLSKVRTMQIKAEMKEERKREKAK
jgi:hypothetical protein